MNKEIFSMLHDSIRKSVELLRMLKLELDNE